MSQIAQNKFFRKRILYENFLFVYFSAFVYLWQFQPAFAQVNHRDDLPYPNTIIVDTATNTVSWRHHSVSLLKQLFEEEIFPPVGWTALSGGKGWMRSGMEPFFNWIIPECGSGYALTNDDSASVSNNGSLDRIISPVMDLTLVDSCLLIYSSFFNAAYGQAARVEYRLSEWDEWSVIGFPPGGFGWEMDTVDLTALAGPHGAEWIQLAFHADDMGNHASGWAIDEVEVNGIVLSPQRIDYLLFWDGEVLDSVTGNAYPLPFTFYGEVHQFGICARYAEGNSDTVLLDIESHNLPPPRFLQANTIGNYIILEWACPFHPSFCDPLELQFSFLTEADGIQAGCESDGEFIYISYQGVPKFDKYDLAGNYIETFEITGIPGILDLAYDPYYGYMYGGHGGNIIYVMDFTNKVLVDQFTAPCTVRGLAYNPIEEIFFANNLSSDITLFELDGDTLFSFPVGGIGNYYGLAVDWEDDGYLWGFSRDESGALMVQYDVPGRQMTGLTIDASSLGESGGQACGLYINYEIVENCATLGGNLNNDITFGYALREELGWGWDPPGVDHYILYNQDTIIYETDGYYYYYHQPGYEEMSYEFHVSAWYDLSEFGFPGLFAESSKDGPVTLNSYIPDPNLTLDFLENWESGSFYTNQWDTIGNGWKISSSSGNPLPSVVFRDVGNDGSYDASLTNDGFIVGTEDSCEVLLFYDMKIVDPSPTGQQSMRLEVLDMTTHAWFALKTYHNDTLMQGYITDSIILTSYVHNHTLKFRFHVYGSDATDVVFWVIDNINVKLVCLPPFAMDAEILPGQDSVLLTWQHHYAEDMACLQYDDSLKFIDAGLGDGPETWYDVAAHWDFSTVQQYDQYFITGMSFVPTMAEAFYIPKIWAGSDGEKLIHREIITDQTIGQWCMVDVEPPIPLTSITDLWIGYSCSSRAGLPFAMDNGPANDGYGNLVRLDSTWTSMLSLVPTLDGNFNLQARLEKPAKNTETFQVFRSIDGLPFQHIATSDSNYLVLPFDNMGQEQCFRTRLICYNRPDFIRVSGFSDVDCVTAVSVYDLNEKKEPIRIYPNPTTRLLTIESAETIEIIDVYNSQGLCAGTFPIKEENIQLDLSYLKPGIYFMKIHSEGNYSICKFIILP